MDENILIKELIFNSEYDYSNCKSILEDIFNDYNINLKKKILVCAIELIQNNLIHNKNKELRLYIYDSKQLIKLSISIFVSKKTYNTLLEKINHINSLDLDSLKLEYVKNLKKGISQKKQYTGNGLITCKLKSKNMINLKIIENCEISKYMQIELSLKFDKYANY